MKIYDNVLQIKVALLDFKPTIFRTFMIAADSNFLELHTAIQETMGWDTSHLFAFRKGNDLTIGIPNEDNEDFGIYALDLRTTKLADYLHSPKNTITYEYDFGDGWEHKVEVQKVFEQVALPQLPFCIKGTNACPLEDCGGTWGYQNLIEISQNKKHPEYKEMNNFYDFKNLKPWDFDIDSVNENLKDFKVAVKYHYDIVAQIEQAM